MYSVAVSFVNGACGKILLVRVLFSGYNVPNAFPRVFQSFREKYFLYFLPGGYFKRRKRIRYSLTFPRVFRVNIISKY